jgi:hypothetical protein
MHFMISTPRPVPERPASGLVGRLLNAASVVVNMASIHILLTGRFVQAAMLARSLSGILFAPFAAGFLFCRRIVKAVRKC